LDRVSVAISTVLALRLDETGRFPIDSKQKEIASDCSPAIKASDAAAAVGVSSHIPIYISSDENDPYSPEDLEILKAIVVSRRNRRLRLLYQCLHRSRNPT
jgi:hypothetical protein